MLDTLVSESTDPEMQRELFVVLADRLALTVDTQPGMVMEITLSCPDQLLGYMLFRCGYSGN